MRLLRIIGSTDPATGGPWEGVVRGTAVLAGMGHETEIVSLDPPDATWLERSRVPVRALGSKLFGYRYAPRLAPWLRSNAARFDAAIVHGIWSYASAGTWLALRSCPVPYFVFPHGMMDPWFRQAEPLKHAARQLYWLAVEGRVLNAARCVLFTSEEERRLARGTFFGHSYREQVVAYGAADVGGDEVHQIRAFHEALPSLANRRFLLFLGRLDPKKGCDLLLRGFAAMAAFQPDLDLVMAGPDRVGWKAALETLARELGVAERVHWPGMLTGEAKWGALRAAEAFVLPSHQENFGIAVAEALACSRPVLITDKVNIWREVAAAEAGIVGPDDEAGVTAALRTFVGLDRDRRSAMGAAARQAFQRHFTVEAAARDLVRVIEQTR